MAQHPNVVLPPPPPPLPRELGYFVEWGGGAWSSLLERGLDALGGKESLAGKRVLEVGCRYGKLSALFGLLGATVTGLDIREEPLAEARAEAERWGLTNVRFAPYNGDLDEVGEETFDLIVTKSVLVLVPDLADMLAKMEKHLAPGGQVLVLENRRGPWWLHLLRRFRHRSWRYDRASFFGETHLALLQSRFDTVLETRSLLPPIQLFVGRRRPA